MESNERYYARRAVEELRAAIETHDQSKAEADHAHVREEIGDHRSAACRKQLERQLVDLAATPAQASMARHLVSATRKMAPFKPSEMVLREILCMTWVLLDENFKADPENGSLETP